MKDLPKVFANKIDKNISNNRNFSYESLGSDNRDVKEKIAKLFNDRNTVYSIDCIITLESGKEKHTIIGKTEYNLITKREQLIPIKDIYDIELA